MSASTWLIPLNIHHSLSLRTVAKNSRHLQNISTSIYALTHSLQSLEKSALEIAGSTNMILSLLESKEHKESTIAAMRMLLFRHQQTCSEAVNEDDKLTAIASCIISKRLLHQNWFNIDLFSYESFDEMTKADEILRNCSNLMDEIRSKLSKEEIMMIKEFPRFLDIINQVEDSENENIESIVKLLKSIGHSLSYHHLSGFGDFSIRTKGFWGGYNDPKTYECKIVQYREEYSDEVWKTTKYFYSMPEYRLAIKLEDHLRLVMEQDEVTESDFPRYIPFSAPGDEEDYGSEAYLIEFGVQNFLDKLIFNEYEIPKLGEIKKRVQYWDYGSRIPATLLGNFETLKNGVEKIKIERMTEDKQIIEVRQEFNRIFKGRLEI